MTDFQFFWSIVGLLVASAMGSLLIMWVITYMEREEG